MNLINLFLLLFYLYIFNSSLGKTISYMNVEHTVVEYFNPKYVKNASFTSRRTSRRDPRHYVELYLDTLIELNKSMEIGFYFYEFLTNRYHPSFIEMHFVICDMIKSDNFIGAAVKKALHGKTCPIPAGKYTLENMTLPFVPTGFPFTKGRVFANTTLTAGHDAGALLISGRADIEIKAMKYN